MNELFSLFALQGFVRILSFDKPVRHLMLGCQHVEWPVPVCHQQTYRGILNTVHTQTFKIDEKPRGSEPPYLMPLATVMQIKSFSVMEVDHQVGASSCFVRDSDAWANIQCCEYKICCWWDANFDKQGYSQVFYNRK